MSEPLDIKAIKKCVHLDCEDAWYSCPKSSEGCANEFAGIDCNCGADSANEIIDKLCDEVDALRERVREVERMNGLAQVRIEKLKSKLIDAGIDPNYETKGTEQVW